MRIVEAGLLLALVAIVHNCEGNAYYDQYASNVQYVQHSPQHIQAGGIAGRVQHGGQQHQAVHQPRVLMNAQNGQMYTSQTPGIAQPIYFAPAQYYNGAATGVNNGQMNRQMIQQIRPAQQPHPGTQQSQHGAPNTVSMNAPLMSESGAILEEIPIMYEDMTGMQYGQPVEEGSSLRFILTVGLCMMVVYFVLGCAMNISRGRVGTKALPNHAFWVQAAGGAVFYLKFLTTWFKEMGIMKGYVSPTKVYARLSYRPLPELHERSSNSV